MQDVLLRAATNATPVASPEVTYLPVFQLRRCHEITNNLADFRDLILSPMKEQGFHAYNPIEVFYYGNDIYILNGHHRAWAAQLLKIKEVPTIEIKQLPFNGYETIDDVLKHSGGKGQMAQNWLDWGYLEDIIGKYEHGKKYRGK